MLDLFQTQRYKLSVVQSNSHRWLDAEPEMGPEPSYPVLYQPQYIRWMGTSFILVLLTSRLALAALLECNVPQPVRLILSNRLLLNASRPAGCILDLACQQVLDRHTFGVWWL